MAGDFNPAIWRDVIRNIGNAEVTLIDLGFIAGGPKAAATWPSDAIAVGHSLGLLWLLHRAGEEEGHAPFRGLVSIQGFDCFCCHIPPSRVAGMRRGLRRDPARPFRPSGATAALEPSLPRGAQRRAARRGARLADGLGCEQGEGGLPARRSRLPPATIPVVPQAMSEAIWGSDTIDWSKPAAMCYL